MLVTIVRGGGLGGFVRRTELDSTLLPPDAIAQLRELFDAIPRKAPVASGPDELRYELTVVDDEVTWSMRTAGQDLAEVIAFVDGRSESVDTVLPL